MYIDFLYDAISTEFQQKISQLSKNNTIKKQQIQMQSLQNDLSLIKQQIDDQGLQYNENSIFSRYATIQQLAQKKKTSSDCCFGCGEEIKKTIQCQLCAEIFCKNCCSRRRVIPYQQHSDFRLCCQECHKAYIKFFNHQKFYKQSAIYMKAIQELQRKYQKVHQKYDKRQQEIKQYKQQKRSIKMKQAVLKKAILQQEKKVKQLNDQYEKIIRQKAQKQKQLQQKRIQQQIQQRKKRQQQLQLQKLQAERQQYQRKKSEEIEEIKSFSETNKKIQQQLKEKERLLKEKEDRLQEQKTKNIEKQRALAERLRQIESDKKAAAQKAIRQELLAKEQIQKSKHKNIKQQLHESQGTNTSQLLDKPPKIYTNQSDLQINNQTGKTINSISQQQSGIKINQLNSQNSESKTKSIKSKASLQQEEVEQQEPPAHRLTMNQIKTMDINDLLSMKIPMNPGRKSEKKKAQIQDLRRSQPDINLQQSQSSQSQLAEQQALYQSAIQPMVNDTPIAELKSTRQSRQYNDQASKSRKQESQQPSIRSFKQEQIQPSEAEKQMTKNNILRRSSLITSNNASLASRGRAPEYNDNEDDDTQGDPNKCSCQIM